MSSTESSSVWFGSIVASERVCLIQERLVIIGQIMNMFNENLSSYSPATATKETKQIKDNKINFDILLFSINFDSSREVSNWIYQVICPVFIWKSYVHRYLQ